MLRPKIPPLDEFIDLDGSLAPIPLTSKTSLDGIALMRNVNGMRAAYDAFCEKKGYQWAHDCQLIDEKNATIEQQSGLTATANMALKFLTFKDKPYFDNFETWYASEISIQRQLKSNQLQQLIVEYKGIKYQASDQSQIRIIGRIQMMQIKNESSCHWRTADNQNIEMSLEDMIGLASEITATLERLIVGEQ